MNSKTAILHFIVTLLLLFITIYFIGLTYENNDANAASMYLVVFGFLGLVFWVISYSSIIASLYMFRKSKLNFLAFIFPSLIFFIAIWVLSADIKNMLWALAIVSSGINFVFYFVHSKVVV